MIGRRVEDCPGRELGKFVKPSCTAVPRGVRPPPDHYSDRGAERHYLSYFFGVFSKRLSSFYFRPVKKTLILK